MKAIDIWNEVLISRGIPADLIAAARPITNFKHAKGAALMEREIAADQVETVRKDFEQIADDLLAR